MQALENVRVVKAAAGKNHTLFLTSGGEVWVCGGNQFGQLGLGKVHFPRQLLGFFSPYD
jgi:alpha-tubulin suppressor-like RCC1 family protein